MRKFIRDRLPGKDGVLRHRWLQPLQRWLHHPNLWHLNRHSVAGGVALGLFCGLIPGPFQMLGAVLLAIWLRVNLPLSLATTLYTNPFTIVPLYLLAHHLGVLVGGGRHVSEVPSFPAWHWHDGMWPLWHWLEALGKPLLLGLPLLAMILAVAGYLGVRLAWRLSVLWRWRQRQRRRGG